MRECLSKRELNRRKRCDSIVDTATRAFLEQGYAATSMSAIAEQLGGSKATLWSHFSSKEDLFVAVVDAQVEAFARDIEDVLTTQTFSVPTLRRFCLRFVECLLRPNSVRLFRLIMGEGERFPELAEVFWVRGPAKMMTHVSDFFATRFDPAEAERLARLTIAMIVGYRSQALLAPEAPGRADAERYVDSFIAHLRLPEPTRA